MAEFIALRESEPPNCLSFFNYETHAGVGISAVAAAAMADRFATADGSPPRRIEICRRLKPQEIWIRDYD
jgi:hypothetical protein